MDAGRDTTTCLGVRDVRGILRRAESSGMEREERLVSRRGVVGRWLPPLSTQTLGIARGDLLVLATDGIDPGFELAIAPGVMPGSLAERILSTHARHADDALVLVARYRGVAA